jgi:hypothetical protein
LNVGEHLDGLIVFAAAAAAASIVVIVVVVVDGDYSWRHSMALIYPFLSLSISHLSTLSDTAQRSTALNELTSGVHFSSQARREAIFYNIGKVLLRTLERLESRLPKKSRRHTALG